MHFLILDNLNSKVIVHKLAPKKKVTTLILDSMTKRI